MNPLQVNKKREYYPFLDGCRGVAILSVLLFHGTDFFSMSSWYFPIFISKILAIGYVGVIMFFVISGFLITGVLIEDWSKPIRVKRFYGRRFFKIYPMYVACLICTFFVYVHVEQIGLRYSSADSTFYFRFFSHFLFLQNYVSRVSMLIHSWSLAVEEHFYLFYPLFLCALFRWVSHAHARRKVAIVSVSLLIIIFIIIRNTLAGDDIFTRLTNTNQPLSATHYTIDALLFGCLLKFLQPYFHLENQSKSFPLVCFFGSVGMFLLLCFRNEIKIVDEYLLSYFASGLMLLSGLYRIAVTEFIFRNRILIWIGKYSYGIYLWHMFVFTPLKAFFGGVIDGIYLFFFFILLSILLGFVTTRVIEAPSLGLRSKMCP